MKRLGAYVQIVAGLALVLAFVPEVTYDLGMLLAAGGFLVAAGVYTLMLSGRSNAEEDLNRAKDMLAAVLALRAAVTVIERHGLEDEMHEEAESVMEDVEQRLEWQEFDPVAADVMQDGGSDD